MRPAAGSDRVTGVSCCRFSHCRFPYCCFSRCCGRSSPAISGRIFMKPLRSFAASTFTAFARGAAARIAPFQDLCRCLLIEADRTFLHDGPKRSATPNTARSHRPAAPIARLQYQFHLNIPSFISWVIFGQLHESDLPVYMNGRFQQRVAFEEQPFGAEFLGLVYDGLA